MNETTVELTLSKPCKHSVVFASSDKDAAVQSIYIKRPFAENAKKVTVTIRIVE